MHELLEIIDFKLIRANEQVGTLAGQIKQWISSDPIKTKCELCEGRLGFRLVIEPFSEILVKQWGLGIGECVHNLRSALDNLTFALARLVHDQPANPDQIFFPIFQNRDRFERSQKVRKSLDQIPPQAASLIERLQPFQRDESESPVTPDNDPLVLLQWLNNHDKHRTPSLLCLNTPKEMHQSFSVEFYSEEDASANVPPDVTVWLDALRPGVVLLEQKTNRPVAKVKGSFSLRVDVTLNVVNKQTPVIPILDQLGRYTTMVVNEFRPFFQ
jgi:hypothetical protein